MKDSREVCHHALISNNNTRREISQTGNFQVAFCLQAALSTDRTEQGASCKAPTVPGSDLRCPTECVHGVGTNLHQPPGLADDRVLQAVQDEAIDLPQESHGGLSDLLHEDMGSVYRGRGRLRVRDQLHQRDIIRWVHLREGRRRGQGGGFQVLLSLKQRGRHSSKRSLDTVSKDKSLEKETPSQRRQRNELEARVVVY